MAGAGPRTRKDGTPSAKVGSIEVLRPKQMGPGMPSMREVRALGAAADAGPATGKRAEDLAARAQSARSARTAFMAARRGEQERAGAAAAAKAAPPAKGPEWSKKTLTPAHEAAVSRAEMGYGARSARRNGAESLKTADHHVAEASKHLASAAEHDAHAAKFESEAAAFRKAVSAPENQRASGSGMLVSAHAAAVKASPNGALRAEELAAGSRASAARERAAATARLADAERSMGHAQKEHDHARLVDEAQHAHDWNRELPGMRRTMKDPEGPVADKAAREAVQAKIAATKAGLAPKAAPKLAEPPAPTTKGPTPLQEQKLLEHAAFHNQRATRADVYSAADRSEMPAHGMAAAIYRVAAKGGDVEAAIASHDKAWREHAAKVADNIKGAPKTKYGPYSGQSAMRDHWANPDKVSQMAPEIRATIAREMGTRHAPEAEARHAAWKAGDDKKWTAITKADRAQDAAGLAPTPKSRQEAADAHREAAAAMRAAPSRHAPDHPLHAKEKADHEEHAKWREKRAAELEAAAHAQFAKERAKPIKRVDPAAAKLRADRAASKAAREAAEQALHGGPALNPATGKTIRLTTSDGKGREVPVIHRQGDYVLHRPASSAGISDKGFTVTHAPTGLNVGSIARNISNKTEGKAIVASLNHPDFKKAFDAYSAAPKTNNGREIRAIQETWQKVKPVPVEKVSTKRAVAMLSASAA